MSGVEAISKCPNCGKAMMMKWESSSCGFMFDACPHCMFLNHRLFEFASNEQRVMTWQIILNVYSKPLKTLRAELDQYIDELDEPAFDYSKLNKSALDTHTRLGGDSMFYVDSRESRKEYDFFNGSTRITNHNEKSRLQRWFKMADNQTELNNLMPYSVSCLFDEIPF